MKRLLLMCTMFLASLVVDISAQDVTISSAFDTTRIYIGDQIGFTVTVEQPVTLNVFVPELKDTICDKVEILGGPLKDTAILDDERIRITNKYLVTSFDSGFYVSHPVYAEIEHPDGTERLYTGYSRLEVSRVSIAPADTTDVVYDIVAPYGAPMTIDEVLPWVLLAVLIAAAVYGLYRLLYFIIRKRIKNGEEEIEVPREPAHIVAFRELEKLRGEELWQKGDIKEYYSRLTCILRQYLDDRYGINSMELTTAETLYILVRTGFKKDEQYSKLKMILDGSDLVKFAKHNPGNEIHESFFDETKHFVDVTMEKVVAEDNTVGKNIESDGNNSQLDKQQLKDKEDKR